MRCATYMLFGALCTWLYWCVSGILCSVWSTSESDSNTYTMSRIMSGTEVDYKSYWYRLLRTTFVHHLRLQGTLLNSMCFFHLNATNDIKRSIPQIPKSDIDVQWGAVVARIFSFVSILFILSIQFASDRSNIAFNNVFCGLLRSISSFTFGT